jgi:hypothetical protein
MKEIPNNGTYRATTGGIKLVVYEADSGSLCVALPVTLQGSEVAWSGKTTLTLGKSDGSLQTRTIENLQAIFPEWAGDPFALGELETKETVFEVVGQQEKYADRATGEDRLGFKIQWVNPIGGGIKMPEALTPAEVKDLKSKWGAKFKAVAKSSAKLAEKVVAETPEPTPEPVKKSTAPARKAPAAAKKVVRELSANLVSELLAKKLFGTTELSEAQESEHSTKWFEAMDELFGVNVTAETPEQFGQLADKLGV